MKRRTFIQTLGAICLPSYDLQLFNSKWPAGVGGPGKPLEETTHSWGKYGVINRQGEIVIPPKFLSIFQFSEGLADARETEKTGYIDITGQWVIPPIFEVAREFKDGLAPVAQEEGKWGYIDPAGEVVVPFQYDSAEAFEDGMGKITLNDLYGCIDVTGKLVIPPLYFVAEPFSEGLAYVVRDDRKGIRAGYINKSGEVVIKMKSGHYGRSFHSGLAGVEKNDKWGFIDKTGKWVIKPSYRKIDRFSDGVCSVKV